MIACGARYDLKKPTRLCVPVAMAGTPLGLKSKAVVPFTATALRRLLRRARIVRVCRERGAASGVAVGLRSPFAVPTVVDRVGAVRGAAAIVALRCCKRSDRFEDFWERRATAARAEVRRAG